MIPKVFHRLHLGTERLPWQVLAWDKKLLELNPGWGIRYWRPADLPPLANQALYELSGNLGHRADIARYEILHRFGGVYLDWDMDPREPMPDLSGVSAFAGRVDLIPWAGVQFEVEIAILGTEPNHPFYAYLLEQLTPWAFCNLSQDPVIRTGPYFFDTMLAEWTNQNPDPGVKLYDVPAFYPVGPWDKNSARRTYPGSHFVHHWWGSWISHRQPSHAISPTAGRKALAKLLSPQSSVLSPSPGITPTSSTSMPTPAASSAAPAA